jgi:hypothetical protein
VYVHRYNNHGSIHYEVRDSDWNGGKVRPRRIVQLGRFPTIEEAYEHFLGEYLKTKRTGKHAPFSPAQEKAWRRITRLSGCLTHEQGAARQPDMRYLREYQRWERHERRQEAIKKGRERAINANPWKILGITKRATADQIKAARDRLAKRFHPDLGGDPSVMIQINEAYETLTE